METLPDKPALRAAEIEPSQVRAALASSAMAWVQALGAEPPSAWLVEMEGGPAVLRRYQDETDVGWEHEFAQKLAATGFPAPRPVRAFSGESWARIGAAYWGMMTYLPGRPLAWEAEPNIAEAGALLAAYHDAVAGIRMEGERPTGTPLYRLEELAHRQRIRAGLRTEHLLRRFERLFQELPRELGDAGYDDLERTVIHGDFTTDNIIIDGEPPRIVGAIDFGFTYEDARLADIGFALWRSGRAEPSRLDLDTGRVARFVAGYQRRRPLNRHDGRTIAAFIWARGVQLVVRWTRRAAPGDEAGLQPVLAPVLERAEWAWQHLRDLEEAAASGMEEGRGQARLETR